MSAVQRVTRRVFLRQFGTTSFAIAVFGLSACSTADRDPNSTSSSSANSPGTGTTTSTSQPTTTSAGPEPEELPLLEYRRVNLGNVSAYILIRSGEAAIVDTGLAGSEADIEAGLRAAGLNWTDVDHVILTHRHSNHIGSADAVMAAADAAVAYAGEADIAQIPAPRPIVPVGDGDEVFGLQIIDTPGHTPGHICVLDTEAGVLVAGDALNGAGGGVIGPNPSFTPNMELANESVKKLAGFSFETVLFGHGDPVEGGADSLVSALAEGL